LWLAARAGGSSVAAKDSGSPTAVAEDEVSGEISKSASMDEARRSLERALAWLAEQQHQDGGWHSQTYGARRQGAAVTSLVLYAASHAPENARDARREAWPRGFEFLKPGMARAGFVANADGSADYPTYATAMLLVAAKRMNRDMPAAEREKLLAFLLRAQLTAERGFAADHPHRGGWDFVGVSGDGVTPGSNVSVTSYVLEAIAASDGEQAAAARNVARGWLLRCRNGGGDGGFFFSPDPLSESNKAEWEDEKQTRPRSYGSATCDGLLGLVYCGAKPDDAAVTAAAAWLARHAGVKSVPGFDDASPTAAWDKSLRFYYLASLAKSLPYLPEYVARNRRHAVFDELVASQRKDGSWRNDSDRMREDDPLIATSLAVVALGTCLEAGGAR
jgi:hypothetical protein